MERPTRARLLMVNHTVSPGLYSIEDMPDRRGNVSVKDSEGRSYQVHKQRLLDENLPGGMPVAVDIGGHKKVACPQCSLLIDVPANREVLCPDHGKIEYIWLGDQSMSDIPVANDAPQQVVNDLKSLRVLGELWTKRDVKFDHPQFDVKSHVLIVKTPSGVYKKLCVNSYDGTFGQKSKGIDVQSLMSDGESKGKTVGYVIKGDIDATRQQLQSRGYEIDVSTT